MNPEEFIAETLRQIVSGVKSAQETTGSLGAIVSPGILIGTATMLISDPKYGSRPTEKVSSSRRFLSIISCVPAHYASSPGHG